VFLAAVIQRIVREAVLVQAPASASVVPSAGVRVVDTSVSGGIAASVAGRVVVCRERVIVDAASRRCSGKRSGKSMSESGINLNMWRVLHPIPVAVTFSKAQSSKIKRLFCHVSVKRDV